MRLYIWYDVFSRYGSPGIAFAFAETKEDAIELLHIQVDKKFGTYTIGKKECHAYIDTLLNLPCEEHEYALADYLEAGAG